MLAALDAKEVNVLQDLLRRCIDGLEGRGAESPMIRAPASSTVRRAPRRAAAR
jgi:hypothetical protein